MSVFKCLRKAFFLLSICWFAAAANAAECKSGAPVELAATGMSEPHLQSSGWRCSRQLAEMNRGFSPLLLYSDQERLTKPDTTDKKINARARLGFKLVVIGSLIYFPLVPLAIVGMILCISVLLKEKKAPGTLTHRRKKQAVQGIIIGCLAIAFLAVIIVIATGFKFG